MADGGIRFLTRADALAAGAGDFALAIADVVDVLKLMRTGEATMVDEAALPLAADDPQAKAYALPATVGGRFGAAGVKWTVHRHTPGKVAPGIASLTLLNDLGSGEPTTILESALLTAQRTAAVSALALRHLKTTPLRRVALLGAGAQANAHLDMLLQLFPGLAQINIWNRTRARAEAMLAGVSNGSHIEIVLCDAVAEAVRDTDAIIAATAAPEPLLGPEAIRAGRIVLQIGYHEASFEAIDAADVVTVDLWGGFCRSSAKSLFQMHRAGRFEADRVAADLSAIVLDGWRPPTGASVYFSSFGLNVFDIALAARIAKAAAHQGLGTMLTLESHAKGEPL
jgi:ornithine cyclodeaminase